MNPDDFGTTPFQQDRGMQPPETPEWSAAHDIRLSKLDSSLQGVEDDYANDTIDDDTYRATKDQIARRRQPLLMQKQAFSALQEQQAEQQEMKAMARQQMMQQQNAQHAAENFHQGVATVADPETGKRVTYAQVKPGHFEPVDFGDDEPQGVSEEAGVTEGSQNPQGGSVPLEPHTLTINGQDFTYDRDERGDWRQRGYANGPSQAEIDAQHQYETNGGYVDPGLGQRAMLDRKAREMGAVVPPGKPRAEQVEMQGMAGSLSAAETGRIADAVRMSLAQSGLHPGMRGYGEAFSKQTLQLRGRALEAKQHATDAETKAKAAETARTRAAVENDYKTFHKAALASVHDEHAAAVKNGDESPYPTAKSRMDAAHDLLMEQFAPLHPDDPRSQAWMSRQQQPTAAAGAKPQQSPDQMDTATLMRKVYGRSSPKQLNDLLAESEKEVRGDTRVVPENTLRGGQMYNPSGRTADGHWQNMDAEGIHDEAARRVRNRLKQMLPAPPNATPSASAGPQPAQQPSTEGQANPAPPPTVKGNTEAAILSAMEKKAATDPVARKQKAQADADQKAAEQVAALPKAASDEERWLAQLPKMPVSQLAKLYDEHRSLKGVSSFLGSSWDKSPEAVEKDEADIAYSARRVGMTPERWKANIVSRAKITPQAVERLRKNRGA